MSDLSVEHQMAAPSGVMKFIASLIARPKATALAVIAMILLLAAGAATLEVNNSARVYLAEGSPEKVALDELEATYSKDENVMFVLTPPAGETVTSPRTLEILRDMTDALWEAPYGRKVVSLVNFVDPIADDNGNGIVVDDLVPIGREADPIVQARLADLFNQRPDLRGNLVSKDMASTTVFLTVSMPSEDLLAVRDVALHSRALKAEFAEKYPGYEMSLTGLVMLDFALTEASEADSGSLVPIMLVLVLVLVGAFFRAVMPPLFVLLAILLSIAGSVGAVAWAGYQLNTASGAAPLIVLVIAVANAVHIITTVYKFRAAHPDLDADAIVTKAVAFNLRPITLTNLTTFVGFMSLNFSDVLPFGELGTIAGIGVILSLIVNLTVVPILLRWWLARRTKPLPVLPSASFERLARYVAINYKWVLFSTSMLAVTAIIGLRLIVFNDNYVEYFDTRNEFRTQTDKVQEIWGGMGLVEYSFEAPDGKTISDPQYLGEIHAFASWLREQPRVNSVIGLPDQLSRLYEAFRNEDLPPGTLPEDPALSAQLLTVFEMSAPYGHSLTDRLTADYAASRLSILTDNMSSADTIELEEKASVWLRKNAPTLADTPGTGLSVAFAHVSERNSVAMLTGNIVAIATISVLLALAWGSLGMGLFSLLPNLLPIGMVFGLWGYFAGEINLAISVVGAMVLGIVVDDTVYILTKYIEARREGKDVITSVASVYTGVGLSLLVTTVVIAAGFAVLATSSFAVNANLGMLALCVVVVALIYDFLLVPAILIAFAGKHAFNPPLKEPIHE